MSLVDLAFDDSTQIPYSAVKDTLQIEDDEVESWLVKEITAKLVDCKIEDESSRYCQLKVEGDDAKEVLQPTPLRLSCDCSFEEGSVYLKVRSARKPKLCPFRLSTDEKTLMWFSSKNGKHLHLSSVRSIIRGHQVRKVQPERESHSFSLIYMTNQAQCSLDLMALNNAQTKTNSSAFRSMLEKHQLTGPNFNEWLRALKLVVRTEKLQDVFETPLPPAHAASADNQALADWNALFDRHNEVACLMLETMSLIS
ncbi:retrotransposon protein, putative, ty1-copia subclass [Tanacetum coccineum]